MNAAPPTQSKTSFSERIAQAAGSVFYKETTPLTNKRDVNWTLISKALVAVLSFCVVVYLALPEGKKNQKDFHEKVSKVEDPNAQAHSMNPTDETLAQLTRESTGVRNSPPSLDNLYSTNPGGQTGSQGFNPSESSMISIRQGMDARDRLPSGTRIPVRLIENVAVSTQGLPVIGVTIRDVNVNDISAIPLGSKVYGEASFDETTERGAITWKSIQLQDGRERPLSGTSVRSDGQAGVDGKVRSESLKNTVGQTMTRFIGAYADGSMERSQFGGNPGVGAVAALGYFYCAAYTPDRLSITRHPATNAASVTNCAGQADIVSNDDDNTSCSWLGNVGFGMPGHNSCGINDSQNCIPSSGTCMIEGPATVTTGQTGIEIYSFNPVGDSLHWTISGNGTFEGPTLNQTRVHVTAGGPGQFTVTARYEVPHFFWTCQLTVTVQDAVPTVMSTWSRIKSVSRSR